MAELKHTGKIGLVRHGETSANVDRIWHGQTDTELTERGCRQAKQLGEYFHHYLHPDVIYCSPLQRASNTAQAIADAFNLTLNPDPRLMEFDLGDWEGASFTSLHKDNDIFDQLVKNPNFTAPNGESQATVKQRVTEAINQIVERHAHQNIVIVAHGVAMSIALAHYLEGDTTSWPKYSKNNTAFSELCLNTNSLIRFNQTDHLSD